jgi:hypothetical protein
MSVMGIYKLVKDKKVKKRINQDKVGFITELVNETVDLIIKKDYLEFCIKEQCGDIEPMVKWLCAYVDKRHKEVESMINCLDVEHNIAQMHRESVVGVLAELMGWSWTATRFYVTNLKYFPLTSNQITIDEPDKPIGKGGFGLVYKGTLTQGSAKRQVAVKKLKLDAEHAHCCRMFIQEEYTLRTCRHRNLTEFLGSYRDGEDMCIVMELADAGNLRDYCSSTDIKFLTKVNIAIDIIEGIEAIHRIGKVHRDIKMENILLFSPIQPTAKITDFGLCADVDEITGTYCGSPMYVAKEVSSRSIYDERADIFSLGVLLYELFSGTRVVDYGVYPNMTSIKATSAVREVINQSTSINPEKRPSLKDIKNDLLQFRDMLLSV